MHLTPHDQFKPIEPCALCRQNHGRFTPATHHYVGKAGICHTCTPCREQVAKLAATFPREFPVPSPLAEPPATVTTPQFQAA